MIAPTNNQNGDVNQYYHTPGFRNVLENHLPALRSSSKVSYHPIEGWVGLKYRSDFYGLLIYLNIPFDLHWVTMRCNDIHSPSDYNGDLDQIISPNENELDVMLKRFRSKTTS